METETGTEKDWPRKERLEENSHSLQFWYTESDIVFVIKPKDDGGDKAGDEDEDEDEDKKSPRSFRIMFQEERRSPLIAREVMQEFSKIRWRLAVAAREEEKKKKKEKK